MKEKADLFDFLVTARRRQMTGSVLQGDVEWLSDAEIVRDLIVLIEAGAVPISASSAAESQ